MKNRITLLSIILAIIFWVVDAFIDSLVSESGITFFKSCFNPDGEKIWMRSFVVLLFLIFSAYTQRLLSIINNITMELRIYHNRLERTIDDLKIEVTKHQRTSKELERLSVIDPLTSIYNRRKFNELLISEIDRSKRYRTDLSIIMCDIDHFKNINDTYGHNVGDTALIAFSEKITQSIRETDIFARWGGEEFMILMPNIDINSARSVAEKLRSIIEKTDIKEVDTFTASFGVTNLNQEDTPDSFIKRVDEVMYKAKNNGRNRVEYIEAQNKKLLAN